MTVVTASPEARLSPFFRLARWLLITDGNGCDGRLIHNPGSTATELVALIHAQRPKLLICGHIPDAAAHDLLEAGIEVRIGPCSVSAASLIVRARDLPLPEDRIG